MVIRKYEAATENDAIMMAMEDLGKDAIVMNIKTVKPKGIYKLFKKSSVEVTAAVDENRPVKVVSSTRADEESDLTRAVKAAYEKKGELNAGFSSKPYRVPADTIQLSQMDQEGSLHGEPQENKAYAIEEKLNNLQKLLEQQLLEQQVKKEEQGVLQEEEEEESEESACLKLIYNQLINSEVAEIYANQLITEIERSLKKDATVDNILANVYQKIVLKLGQPEGIEAEKDKTKFIIFIGPTGVGKTTTIAKIASCFQLKKEYKIALITSDTYRIAAVEQLRTYAEILGIPLRVVYSSEEIQEAVKDFEDYDLVFVDTAGRSHKNQEQQEDLKKILDAVPEDSREIYLVLSAATKYKDLENITERYKEFTDFKIIFTKFDETNDIGNIYNIRMLTNASLSYATWGQNVPDDIGKIDVQDIARQLLGGN